MERDRPTLPLVNNLDLEAEKIAELALEHLKVGIDGLGRVAGAGTANVGAGTRARLFTARAGFGLADRQPLSDDLPGQFFGVFGGRDCTGVTHADIAFQ